MREGRLHVNILKYAFNVLAVFFVTCAASALGSKMKLKHICFSVPGFKSQINSNSPGLQWFHKSQRCCEVQSLCT